MITNQELRDYWKKVADAVSDNKMQTNLPPDAARATKQDTMIASLGNPTDAEATGAGSIIGVLKRLRTLIGDTIVTIGSAIGNKAQLIAGSDGTNARAIKTASDGTLLTQLTGSIPRKVTIETLASAQSVAASGNLDLPYTTQGESEVWVLVNIDKQPWSLRSRLLWASTYGVNNFYPPRNNVSTAYNTVSSPAGSLLLATRALGGGLPEITTMEDAKQYAGAYSTTFRIENGSAETATVTLKVIRIWR
jgi:hypothetical protein